METRKMKEEKEKKEIKSGFVAVVGRPNVGKSSLINAIIGTKVSITSPKPQTTRNKIIGIKNTENEQIIFVDTPGQLRPRNALGEYMKKSIETAVSGIDLLLIVLDGSKIIPSDYKLIESYKNTEVPVIVVINKTDITKLDKVFAELNELNNFTFVKEFISVSAKTGKNIDKLEKLIIENIHDNQIYFERDSYTDKSLRFMVSEIIREKALIYLQKEIPHGIAVDITKYDEGKMVTINADIIATKKNHKQIIIGKNGEMLKKIGTSARKEIEMLLGKKVFLELFVKIRENWQENLSHLKEFGYDKNKL